jgi:hypothetical protein
LQPTAQSSATIKIRTCLLRFIAEISATDIRRNSRAKRPKKSVGLFAEKSRCYHVKTSFSMNARKGTEEEERASFMPTELLECYEIGYGTRRPGGETFTKNENLVCSASD